RFTTLVNVSDALPLSEISREISSRVHSVDSSLFVTDSPPTRRLQVSGAAGAASRLAALRLARISPVYGCQARILPSRESPNTGEAGGSRLLDPFMIVIFELKT